MGVQKETRSSPIPPVVEGLVVQTHPVLAAVKTGDLHGGPVDLRDHLRGAGELQQLPGPLLVGQVTT
jgi:hypothetical protein